MFAFQDINLWFGLGASNHENCFQMFITQSSSMSWLHKLHFWKCLLTNIRTEAEWLSCIHTAVTFIQSEQQYFIGLWHHTDRKTEGVKLFIIPVTLTSPSAPYLTRDPSPRGGGGGEARYTDSTCTDNGGWELTGYENKSPQAGVSHRRACIEGKVPPRA